MQELLYEIVGSKLLQGKSQLSPPALFQYYSMSWRSMATKLDSSSASFLLNFHPDAQKAAESSLCAAEQNKFSEMHDAMFANQQALAVDQLKARTAQLGMNTGQFNTCLDSGKYIATIKSDQKDGSEAGVSGTPSMFINGRLLMGAVPFDEITKVVGDELRRKGVR